MSLVDPSLTDIINAVAFGFFWLLLVVGATTTIARMAWYAAVGRSRPRLLTRDAVVTGGLALSFGIILFARALDLVSGLRDNWLYSLITSSPGIVAVSVYVYYELFVIERGRDEERDETYLRDTSE